MIRKIGQNELCWCGSGEKYKRCHVNFDNRMMEFKTKGHIIPSYNIIKTKQQIEGIRKSGLINIAILDYVSDKIRIGMSTEEIDNLVFNKTTELGGIPAPLGFEGFPKSVCTSINNQVCHGIPSLTDILMEGDIINVDISTIYNGFYSDSSRMFYVGNVDDIKKKLVKVARECVEIGLEQVKPWGLLGDVGQAIHEHALKNGYSVVQQIGGHGIGLEFHEDPFVSYVSKKGTGMLMVPGMAFTIEPMINMGTDKIYIDQKNDWTAYTYDGKPSAQWEVTVAVTEIGYEILAY